VIGIGREDARGAEVEIGIETGRGAAVVVAGESLGGIEEAILWTCTIIMILWGSGQIADLASGNDNDKITNESFSHIASWVEVLADTPDSQIPQAGEDSSLSLQVKFGVQKE